MQDFRKLRVWHEAQALAADLYRATEHFPKREHYTLGAQIRRSAVSISSNIAEGCGRDGPAELSRFLQIAIGSASELLSQLDLAERLGLIPKVQGESLWDRTDFVRRTLISLKSRVEMRRRSV